MYSPKISEDLVHVLYFVAKDRKVPMTRLVDNIIRDALASNNLPQANATVHDCGICATPNAEPQSAVA